MFTIDKQRIIELVKQIDRNAEIAPINDELIIRASSLETCQELALHSYLWRTSEIKATLQHPLCGGWRTYSSDFFRENIEAHQEASTVKPGKFFWDQYRPQWLAENREIFGLSAPIEHLYRFDQTGRDLGFPCTAVKAIPERLNKPLEDTLGQPLHTMADGIAKPREAALLGLYGQEIGSIVQYQYSMEWKSILWEFHGMAKKVTESDVLVLTFDSNPSQGLYWLNRT